jgi:HAD domain in Swiss Army Knife RNA repair proteins
MKVIFLDFDGVLNSAASFLVERRIRQGKHTLKNGRVAVEAFPPVSETLCRVCTSNFQHVLDEVPDAKIVISSTWRQIFTLDQLRDKLSEYGVDSSRVIGMTPETFGGERGREIEMWMTKHPEVTSYVILDDNYIGPPYQDNHYDLGPNFVKTTWNVGLTLALAVSAVKVLGGKDQSVELRLE